MANPLCVVVGYGSGVGQGIAQAFAQAGFGLLLVSRSPQRQAQAFAQLQAAGAEAQLLAADAGDPLGLADSLRQALADGGAMGEAAPLVLAYNAVVPTLGPPSTLAPDRLAADLQVDVVGALAAVHALLPALRQRGGALLFTGGGMAHHPVAAAASIGIGKAALRALVLTLAQELAPEAPRLGVGMVTIMGQVAPGGPFDPLRIGEAFVDLQQRLANATVDAPVDPELLFRG